MTKPLFSFTFDQDALHRAYERYHQLEAEIEQLTGYDLESLKWLFQMGYTLQRPLPEMSLKEFARLVVQEERKIDYETI